LHWEQSKGFTESRVEQKLIAVAHNNPFAVGISGEMQVEQEAPAEVAL